MSTYILLSEKSWHDSLFESLQRRVPGTWVRIASKDDFQAERLENLKPDWIFIPHWSHLVPEPIVTAYRCVIFHMTDLPYGRGGSPLQNLIVRSHTETMVSAIRAEAGIDTGPVYLKRPLSLDGSAAEIFQRSAQVIGQMIEEIVAGDLVPAPQEGEATVFPRRRPDESDIAALTSTQDVFDYIRMLDCEGYPRAFLETAHLRFEFSGAGYVDGVVEANVRISKK